MSSAAVVIGTFDFQLPLENGTWSFDPIAHRIVVECSKVWSFCHFECCKSVEFSKCSNATEFVPF